MAARKLGVEHTTVSRRLATLEEALGVPVFYRTAGGYLLTPVGEGVLSSAEAMERAALATGAHARESTGRIAGRVRVALPPEFASHWLAPNLAAFHARQPAIDLHILAGTRPLNLSRGEAELAVRSPHPRQPGLVAVRIAHATLGLYASKTLIAGKRMWIDRPAAVLRAPLLVYTPPFHVLQNAKWFEPVLAAAAIGLETNSTQVLLEAARASAGIAVLPRFIVRGLDDLVPVSPDVAGNDVWLVTHPEFRRDPKVRVTADFLKRIAGGPGGLC